MGFQEFLERFSSESGDNVENTMVRLKTESGDSEFSTESGDKLQTKGVIGFCKNYVVTNWKGLVIGETEVSYSLPVFIASTISPRAAETSGQVFSGPDGPLV